MAAHSYRSALLLVYAHTTTSWLCAKFGHSRQASIALWIQGSPVRSSIVK
jgi:hypothetical protein